MPKEIRAAPGYLTIMLEQHSTALQEVVVTGYALEGRAPGVAIRGVGPTTDKKEAVQNVAITMQYQPTAVIYSIDEKYTL